MSARYTSTAATTCGSAPPAATSAPVRPSSTTPTPPGVSGSADSSRTNENAASVSCQLTSSLLTPTWRSDRSSTTNSDRWLMNVQNVSAFQRCRSRSIVSVRNFTSV